MIYLVGIGTCLIGLSLYEHFSGENPITDTAYELWLRRQNLAALDRAAADNTCRADVVVTLTTLPSRIPRIELTLKSLLRQTTIPRAIRLNVPLESRRERVRYDIPDWLQHLQSLTIVRCDDYGPATKLIPTLRDSAPDDRVLVVDDDRVYHPYFVQQMLSLSGANPDTAIAGSGWNAPPDLIDRPTTLAATLFGRAPAPLKCTRVRNSRHVDVMQGLAGYLVKPRFFDLDAMVDYTHAPAAAFFVDDVWISAQCRAPKIVFKGRRTNFPSLLDARFYKRSSVALVNRGNGTPASRNNTIMLRHFANRWRMASRKPPSVG